MISPLPRLWVFDIDDTLYLEDDYVHSGFEAVGAYVARELGAGGFAAVCAALYSQGHRGDVFNRALAECGLPVEVATVQRLVDVYRQHSPAIALLEDARALLATLSGQAALSVISDGPLVSQQNKVRALGLERFAEPIVLTDGWGRAFWKPHLRAFETVQDHHHAAGEECVYVADNPAKDFRGPKQLGWRTVRVRRPGGQHVHATASADEVDIEIPDFNSWLALPGRDGRASVGRPSSSHGLSTP